MFKVTLQRIPAAIEFEVGSISELNGILQQEDIELRKFIIIADELSASNAAAETALTAETDHKAQGDQAPVKERKTRGPNKKAADAVAPNPLPVPALPSAEPVEAELASIAEPVSDGIPPFLQRNKVTPPPPPAPVAPKPPGGILAGKIISKLDEMKAGTPDDGKSLVEWLACPEIALVSPGVSFDGAMAALRMIADDRLTGVAGALQV